MKTPASVTIERQQRAKNMAYKLYREYTIDHARKLIKDHYENGNEEGQRFWSLVRNSYEELVNPPRHKPKSQTIALDQCNLQGGYCRECER